MEKLSRHEVTKMLHVSEEALRELSKKHLKYREDYFMHRKHGAEYTVDAVKKLEEILHPCNAVFDADPEEVLIARVCKTLPSNPRFLWIHAPGHDGKGVVQIPQREVKNYRKPGKRITVRHVKDNVFQFARVNIHEQK